MIVKVYHKDELIHIVYALCQIIVEYNAIIIKGSPEVTIELTPETRVEFELR